MRDLVPISGAPMVGRTAAVSPADLDRGQTGRQARRPTDDGQTGRHVLTRPFVVRRIRLEDDAFLQRKPPSALNIAARRWRRPSHSAARSSPDRGLVLSIIRHSGGSEIDACRGISVVSVGPSPGTWDYQQSTISNQH